MSTTNLRQQKSTADTTGRIDTNTNGARRAYIPLGIDERECSHVYDTETETVHIIHPDGARERRVIGAGQSVDDWMDAVDDGWGWAHTRYGIDAYLDRVATIAGIDTNTSDTGTGGDA